MNPYKHADKGIKEMYEFISASFQNMSIKLPSFDELNVIDTKKLTKDLYERIDNYCLPIYRRIARKSYEEAVKEVRGSKGSLVQGFILLILAGYNPTTQYVYSREWGRKRDRMTEGILSVRGNQKIREILQRSINLIRNQVSQYADIITDDARTQAFRDNGISEVRWISVEDARRCKICAERHNKIYPIDDIPEKHPHCRCYLIPVIPNAD